MASALATFEESLASLSVGRTRTTSGEFADALAGVIDLPAVGTPLPYDGVSLDATDVQVDPTPDQLQAATTGVTPVGGAIAEHGTVLVESRPDGDELVSLYPARHVAVLRMSDLRQDVSAAIPRLGETLAAGTDSTVLATGASATADMGETIEGVHGPTEVHVVVLTDR
ncbi:MAG: LUD domain-containing protein [Halolamina sp.]|uniref:LUD domain-containing protein n=1 Tax=Halolamina sp. TaxID=1940283 RepID=UPI002FC2FA29